MATKLTAAQERELKRVADAGDSGLVLHYSFQPDNKVLTRLVDKGLVTCEKGNGYRAVKNTYTLTDAGRAYLGLPPAQDTGQPEASAPESAVTECTVTELAKTFADMGLDTPRNIEDIGDGVCEVEFPQHTLTASTKFDDIEKRFVVEDKDSDTVWLKLNLLHDSTAYGNWKVGDRVQTKNGHRGTVKELRFIHGRPIIAVTADDMKFAGEAIIIPTFPDEIQPITLTDTERLQAENEALKLENVKLRNGFSLGYWGQYWVANSLLNGCEECKKAADELAASMARMDDMDDKGIWRATLSSEEFTALKATRESLLKQVNHYANLAMAYAEAIEAVDAEEYEGKYEGEDGIQARVQKHMDAEYTPVDMKDMATENEALRARVAALEAERDSALQQVEALKETHKVTLNKATKFAATLCHEVEGANAGDPLALAIFGILRENGYAWLITGG